VVCRKNTLYTSSKEENTEQEKFMLLDGAGAAGAIQEMYLETQAADLVQQSIPSQGLGVLEDNVLSISDHMKQFHGFVGSCNTSEDVTTVVNNVLLDIQQNFSPHTSPTSDLVQSNVCLEDAVSNLPTWDEDLEPSPELLLYWAGGSGSPQPFDHHPSREARFVARRNELLRHESLHVALEKKNAEELLHSRKPPTPPDPVPMPGLYHLHLFKDEVALPWSSDHPNGEVFRQRWEDSFLSQEFQERLQGCLWWWTAKKVSTQATWFTHLYCIITFVTMFALSLCKLKFPNYNCL
jgi:hypothetical protein